MKFTLKRDEEGNETIYRGDTLIARITYGAPDDTDEDVEVVGHIDGLDHDALEEVCWRAMDVPEAADFFNPRAFLPGPDEVEVEVYVSTTAKDITAAMARKTEDEA